MTVLGQLLIKSGLVTSRQVEAALRRQEQLGGRLGTCLLELGAITERQLDAALARQLGLPAAQVEDLRGIPEEIHSLLPANLAISCEAVPFRVRDDQVDVAILEIKNRGLHDELAFVIGKWIHVHIANEIRILEALEQYYGKACTLRYRTLIERLDRDRGAEPETSFATDDQGLMNIPFPDLDSEPENDLRGPKLVYPATPVKRRSIELTAEEREALRREVLSRQDEIPTAAIPVQDEPDEAPTQTEPTGATIEQHPSAPWVADSAHQVGELLVEKLGRHFERVALFQIKKDGLHGWLGAGRGLDPRGLAAYRVELGKAPVFDSLVGGGHLFVGRLARNTAHDELLERVGAAAGTECLLTTVNVDERVVAIAYGDRGRDGLDTLDFGAVQQFSQQAGAAIRELILRMKRKRA